MKHPCHYVRSSVMNINMQVEYNLEGSDSVIFWKDTHSEVCLVTLVIYLLHTSPGNLKSIPVPR